MVRVTEVEAKNRFSELLRDVAEGQTTLLIEKDGEPQAVVISLNEYTRLIEKIPPPGEDWKARVDQIRARVAEELGNRPLPPAEDMIRRMREERDERILGSLR